MKNKRDQLQNAFHSLRNDTVSEALAAMEAPPVSKATHTCRRIAVAAACLTFALVAGALLILPNLSPTSPIGPSAGSVGASSVEGSEENPPFYVEAPIVRLDHLSAGETATVSDPSIPVEKVEVKLEHIDDRSHNINVLLFDCLPGETVSIRAATDCLGLIKTPYDPTADYHSQMDFYTAYIYLYHTRRPGEPTLYPINVTPTFYQTEHTFDPTTASVAVKPRYTNPEDDVDDDVLLYTIQNEEGQITGAGGMYVAKKYLIPFAMRDQFRNTPTITRAVLLGSVRFSDPATVTEEQVNDLLASFAAKSEDARSSVDFTPVTTEEIQNTAYYDIVSSIFPDQSISGNWSSRNTVCDYSFVGMKVGFTVDEDGVSHYQSRNFIIFKDGGWAEYNIHRDEDCPYVNCHCNGECPEAEAQGGAHHAFGMGCILETLDGRLYQLEDYDPTIQGKTYTATLIHDPAA